MEFSNDEMANDTYHDFQFVGNEQFMIEFCVSCFKVLNCEAVQPQTVVSLFLAMHVYNSFESMRTSIMQRQQESIPVGYVLPACLPYLFWWLPVGVISTPWIPATPTRDRVYLSPEGT